MVSIQTFSAVCKKIMILNIAHFVIIAILTQDILVRSTPLEGSETESNPGSNNANNPQPIVYSLTPSNQSEDPKKFQNSTTFTNTTNLVAPSSQGSSSSQIEPVDPSRTYNFAISDSEQSDVSKSRDVRDGDFSREDSLSQDDREKLLHDSTQSDSGSHHKPQHSSQAHKDVLVKEVKMQVTDSGLEDEDCGRYQRGPFRKFYPGSKYFGDTVGMYTYERGIKTCMRYGLIPADLENIGDHRSMQKFISSILGDSKCPPKFFIGMNETETKGIFKKWYNGRNITFQTFHRSQPNDKNVSENCVVLNQEIAVGPVGMSGYNCNSSAHMLCMFKPASDCFKEANETLENVKTHLAQGLKLLANISDAAYFVSNFQRTWSNAMSYCNSKDMILVTFDHLINPGVFQKLLDWQTAFAKAPIPPVEYFTAGRFRVTHMNAPIFWHTSPSLVPEEEMLLPHLHEEKQTFNLTFTFSGVYRWSAKKKRDPGAPIMYRRDLCLTFAFEGDGADPTPYVRATNCDLPCYFVCQKTYNKTENPDY